MSVLLRIIPPIFPKSRYLNFALYQTLFLNLNRNLNLNPNRMNRQKKQFTFFSNSSASSITTSSAIEINNAYKSKLPSNGTNEVKLEWTTRTGLCGELAEDDVGRRVRLCGWVALHRVHGGLTFVNLRDHTGIVRVAAEHVHVLNTVKAKLPFLVTTSEDAKDLPSEEIRMRYRCLDLRRKQMSSALILRHRVVKLIRRYLEDKHSFVEIETPILCRSTPEGARDYLVPSRVQALHHPFTAPNPEDMQNLSSARALAYDMVYNGVEIGGGSLRIFKREVQERVLGIIGITPEQAEAKFGYLLEALDMGDPHMEELLLDWID